MGARQRSGTGAARPGLGRRFDELVLSLVLGGLGNLCMWTFGHRAGGQDVETRPRHSRLAVRYRHRRHRGSGRISVAPRAEVSALSAWALPAIGAHSVRSGEAPVHAAHGSRPLVARYRDAGREWRHRRSKHRLGIPRTQRDGLGCRRGKPGLACHPASSRFLQLPCRAVSPGELVVSAAYGQKRRHLVLQLHYPHGNRRRPEDRKEDKLPESPRSVTTRRRARRDVVREGGPNGLEQLRVLGR
jgi:hypothetical protein